MVDWNPAKYIVTPSWSFPDASSADPKVVAEVVPLIYQKYSLNTTNVYDVYVPRAALWAN